MESASFQQPLVPWGSETRLHTGPYMDGSGAGPSAPPSGPRPRPLGVDALLLWEETYLVETGGHKVLLDACPHQPAIPAVLMGPRALEEEKDGTRLSLGGLPGGGTHLRALQRAGGVSWGQLCTQRAYLATKLGLSLPPCKGPVGLFCS